LHATTSTLAYGIGRGRRRCELERAAPIGSSVQAISEHESAGMRPVMGWVMHEKGLGG
jgi:hypothetical protein